MKRLPALAGAMVLGSVLAGGLAGCGGGGQDEPEADSTDSYCDALRDANEEFAAVNSESPDPKQLDSALQRMSEVARQAPDEVQPQWETLDGAITEVRTGLEEAGITFEDLGKLAEDPTALPEDVDQAKLMELATTVRKMDSKEFERASDDIQKHAKSECDIELGS